MKNISTKQQLFGFVYRKAFKPIAFRFDPEDVHDRLLAVGSRLGTCRVSRAGVRALFSFQHPMLVQTIKGIRFENPIGLAAGFDKNAQLTHILPDVGFGFEEVGSITAEPCEGNPRPRLWRHPQQQSIRVYYGLKNDGAEALSKKLADASFRFPVGISIAKTNCAATAQCEAGVEDYLKTYRLFERIGSYDTINISCPNAFGGQPFTDPVQLKRLLEALAKVRNPKPMFLKLSPDLSEEELRAVGSLADAYGVDGLICSNLTKKHAFGQGGLSGKAVAEYSFAQLRLARRLFGKRFILVACGGIFTAEDVYRSIRAGASLIQLITGMIYRGPQTAAEINRGLVALLTRDGFGSLADAVGVDVIE